MSLVTQTLLDLVREQIKAHGTVVWYDPERAYLELAHSLTPADLGDAAIHRYEPVRGFVWLRRQIEPLWGPALAPPRLLIYVPLARSATAHALIEYEVGGVVMAPGQLPPECNTALAAVAQRALAGIRPPAALEQIVAEVAAGKWSLAELDREAERGLEAQAGVLKLVFDTGNPAQIALRFLADPAIDARIAEKDALGTLAVALGDLLGVAFRADEGTEGLRARLARQVLVTDFLAAFGDDPPVALRTFPVAERPAARQAAVELAAAWRNRRDAAASYVRWADQVEVEISAGSVADRPGLLQTLSRSETFAAAEARLQREVEHALIRHASAELVALAETRLQGFWAGQRPEIKVRWDVIADAGRVMVAAGRIMAALKGKTLAAAELALSYADGPAKGAKNKTGFSEKPDRPTLWDLDGPWCVVDTAQRHLERDFHRFEFDPSQHASLMALVAQARDRYAAAVELLAERFVSACEAEKFELIGAVAEAKRGLSGAKIVHQADIFAGIVRPAMDASRVAYLLVDAFRFEMARELVTQLADDWQAELIPALATPPTVTEIGMAALLPGAERGLAVVAADNGGLAAVVDGKTLKTRQERLDHLALAAGGNSAAAAGKTAGGNATGVTVATARLDQLAPLSDTHLRNALKAARLVVVTATEDIDGLCENTPGLARSMLDEVLLRLRRAIKALLGLGISTVIITADHGHLFGEKLSGGQGIDPPGGKTVALKRRVWVGQGGAHIEGTLRAPLSAFGLGGELELVTLRNLSVFKVPGGSTEYFHGGLSPQEIIIPVLIVRPTAPQAIAAGAQIKWKIGLGSPKITTRFVSVTVEGRSEELLPIEPPSVRVEIRAGEKAISVPVSASYGFNEATCDVRLAIAADYPQQIAPVTVTLMITETPEVGQVTVHLLDAGTGISLARVDGVPFEITI